jgi:toxin ParE1/3/4
VRFKWLRRSLNDLNAIHDYIWSRNPLAADQVAQRIQDAALNLKQFPLLGRPSHNSNVRLLQVPGLPYLLPYQVGSDAVEILAVFDERQERPPEWQ